MNDQTTTKEAEIQIEAAEVQHLTFRDLRARLPKFRGKIVPPTTLRTWLKILEVYPDPVTRTYSPEQFNTIARYALWLRRGGYTKGFLTINSLEGPKQNDQQRTQPQQTATAGSVSDGFTVILG